MALDLTEQQREIVELLDAGMSVEEIAEELDRSRSTIRSRLHELSALLGGGDYVRWQEIPALVARLDEIESEAR